MQDQEKFKQPIESKKERTGRFLLFSTVYILLNVVYFIVAREFSYTGFTATINIYKLLLSTIIFIIALLLSSSIKDKLLLFMYNSVLLLFLTGEAICYSYNTYNNPVTLFGSFLILLFMLLFQNINIKTKSKKYTKNPLLILLIISIILFIPFVITNINNINLGNILLQDVYETRLAYRDSTTGILGYMSAPLSRILLPTIMLMSMAKKEKKYAVLCIVMILFIYLCGAYKSILFGTIAALLLYKGDYNDKVKRLLTGIIICLILGILMYYVFNDITIVSFIRRVFFVPQRLGNMYVEYFRNNPTFLSHSPLGLGLSENIYGKSLSMFFGEQVLKRVGGNANTGLLAEGFVSFNTIGVALSSLLIAFTLLYFKAIKTDKIYAGIILSYIFLMNTSFLSPLLITHGLAFLIIFSFLFMREETTK